MIGPRVRHGRPGLAGYVLAAAGGALALTASGVALVGVLWLLPSLLALVLERTPGRPMTRAMTLFGLAASLRPLVLLGLAGAELDAALTLAGNPMDTARSWTAQAAAWLLAEMMSVLLVIRADWQETRDLRRLRESRRELEVEWSAPSSSPP